MAEDASNAQELELMLTHTQIQELTQIPSQILQGLALGSWGSEGDAQESVLCKCGRQPSEEGAKGYINPSPPKLAIVLSARSGLDTPGLPWILWEHSNPKGSSEQYCSDPVPDTPAPEKQQEYFVSVSALVSLTGTWLDFFEH
jgi:hypothetical protein